ncbi:hypothetical protein GCM10027614_01940 [Micromonospora vulcania]
MSGNGNFLRLCRQHHLPVPDLQEHRLDASGRNHWLDAYWQQWRVHVEIDGAHHMDVRQWAAGRTTSDQRRPGPALPSLADPRPPDEVAETVRKALTAAGWTPTPPRPRQPR